MGNLANNNLYKLRTDTRKAIMHNNNKKNNRTIYRAPLRRRNIAEVITWVLQVCELVK